jgi:hypothetical protein
MTLGLGKVSKCTDVDAAVEATIGVGLGNSGAEKLAWHSHRRVELSTVTTSAFVVDDEQNQLTLR